MEKKVREREKATARGQGSVCEGTFLGLCEERDKVWNQTHFLLLQKKTSGEQVLQPAVVVRETRCKSIGNCALYRSLGNITLRLTEQG